MRTSVSRRTRWLLTIVAVIWAGACGIVRVSLPIRGIVVASESGEPLREAVVQLRVETVSYLGLVHQVQRELQVASATAGNDGRFEVGGGVNLLFPFWVGWTNELEAHAPGRWSDRVEVRDAIGGISWPMPFFTPVRIALSRASSLNALRHMAKLTPDLGDQGAAQRLMDETRALLEAETVRAGSPGQFARSADSVFDEVAPMGRLGVVAHDRRGDRVLGWTIDGRVAAPDLVREMSTSRGMSTSPIGRLIATPFGPPFIEGFSGANGTVVLCRDQAMLPVAKLSREPDGGWQIDFIRFTGADATRRLPVEWTVRAIRACAIGTDGPALYIATEDGQLAKLAFEQGRSERREYVTDNAFAANVGRAVGPSSGISPRFVDVRVALTDAGETLYAVALDAFVYRFASDGEPDRLLSEPPSSDG